MIERHLYLMIAEAVIFIFIVFWCVSRTTTSSTKSPSFKHPTEIPSRIRTISGSVSMTTLMTPAQFVKGHKRHSSTDVTPQKPKEELLPCSQDDSCMKRLSGIYLFTIFINSSSCIYFTQ